MPGVSDNRLQNVVFTLDKVKLCLGKPGEADSCAQAVNVQRSSWTLHYYERAAYKILLRLCVTLVKSVVYAT